MTPYQVALLFPVLGGLVVALTVLAVRVWYRSPETPAEREETKSGHNY